MRLEGDEPRWPQDRTLDVFYKLSPRSRPLNPITLSDGAPAVAGSSNRWPRSPGARSSSQIVGFATAREHNPLALSATTLGLVNGMVTGAGAFYQPLVGWFLDLAWTGQMVSGVRVYDADSYRAGLTVLVAGTFLGFLCTLFVREINCRQSAGA